MNEGRPSWTRRAVGLAAAAAVIATLWLARGWLGIETSVDGLRGWVEEMGVWGPVVYVAAVTFRLVLGLPSPLLLAAGGLCFGMIEATFYGGFGIAISGTGLFLAARYAGRDAVVRRVPAPLRSFVAADAPRLGTAVVLGGTAYPVGPITALHLLAGVTGMALGSFVIAVAAGAAIRAATYAFFGTSLVSGEAERVLAGAAVLAGALLVPFALPGPRRWASRLVRGRG